MKTTTTDTPSTDAKAVAITGFYSCATVPADFARELERKLSKAEAEVERLRSTLCRALEIADEFWDNQKQAVLVYHQELADELDQINLKHRIPRSRG